MTRKGDTIVSTDDTIDWKISGQKYGRRKYQEAMAEIRDVGDIPPVADMRLRAQCRYNLKFFLEKAYPAIFYMKWSKDQITLIEELEYRILHGGLKAVAMPRGGGKSSIVFGTTQWAIGYGHRRFIYVIKSDQDSADKFVDGLRRDWETNTTLYDLFPEIVHPIRSLEGSVARARMQTYHGERTWLEWKKDHINFPCLDGFNYSLDNSVGSIITCKGITGSFRGAQHLNPVTGDMMRPDFVILDDVQSDKTATSPTSVQKMIDLIDGAVKGLSPPGQLIAGVMPCTVITDDDVSDHFLSPETKPEWSGMRCSMVISWPDGITDEVITDETRASRFWQEYSNLRIKSLRERGDISLATEFYKLHQEIMDKNYEVSWDERYNKDPTYEGNVEISAQQHAMNLRLENIFTFSAEYQNNPRKILLHMAEMPTVQQVLERTISNPQRKLPYYTSKLVGFIDVQDESLWYGVCGLATDFTGTITDYGVFPEFREVMINKQQCGKLKKLSREFFTAHRPEVQYREDEEGNLTRLDEDGKPLPPNFPDIPYAPGEKVTDASGHARRAGAAPFEAKLYWALTQLVDRLFSRNRYVIQGVESKGEDVIDTVPIALDYLAIDCRWGQAAEVVKRFICEYGDSRLVPYEGMYIGAATRKMHEYARGNGALFEDELHKDLGVCRWVARYDKTTRSRKLLSDVNAWKSFLMLNRLAAPMGAPGAISISDPDFQRHPLLAQHLCKSEYPEPVTARGFTLYEWKETGNYMDNEFLDIFSGCMALGSVAGCRIDDTPVSELLIAGTAADRTPGAGPRRSGPEAQVKVRGKKTKPVAHPATVKRRVKMSEVAKQKAMSRQGGSLTPPIRTL